MISLFRVHMTASERGLCDIDSVIQGYSIIFKKIERSRSVEIRLIIS